MLVVDDNAESLGVIALMLERYGAEVVTVSSGAAAPLETVTTSAP
uniref:Response regulatory domain-containing protein n=1 Tax=Ralstonia solanacearum TaxID=305 RepID=A0A0S4VTH5_RALSL|nr:protein of unknown function [Ralstonia solanacearum]CUV37731.1 protein of unknown function [Ralstonia solanacearum]